MGKYNNKNGKNKFKSGAKSNQKARNTGRNRHEGTNAKEDIKDRYSNAAHTGEVNDVSWYVPDIHMLDDVASIPFNYRTGDRVSLEFRDPSDAQFTSMDKSVLRAPGVVNVRYYPTLGQMKDHTDPVNVASTAVYSWIRHANSGSRNYDSTDLMLYLMAMDSIYTGISFLQRVQAIAMVYSAENRYTPEYLLRGQGVDTTTLYNNLIGLNTRLNQLILKASTLAVPATFPLYQRHAWMVSNIYTDEMNARAQFYQFVPDTLYQFQYDEEGKGMLKAHVWAASGLRTWESYALQLEEMINAVYGDEDAGLMSGDILKAYGEGNLFKLSTIPLTISLVPVYDPIVLHQIHNCTPMGQAGINSLDITQVIEEVSADKGFKGYLYCDPHFRLPSVSNDDTTYHRAPFAGTNKILDLHTDPSPSMVMEATRLMVGSGELSRIGDDIVFKPHSLPTEVVSIVSVGYFNEESTSDEIVYANYAGFLDIQDNYSVDHFGESLEVLIKGSQISYFPTMYAYSADQFNGNVTLGTVAFFSNTDRATVISAEQIDKLNDVARLGLFDIPRLSLGSM